MLLLPRELCRSLSSAGACGRARGLAGFAAAAAAGAPRRGGGGGGGRRGDDHETSTIPPSLVVATPPLPPRTPDSAAVPTTALSWLRRRSALSSSDAAALFRKRAVRVERTNETGGGAGGSPTTTTIGRVSASAVLPAGARLLVPRSALEKKSSSSSSSRPLLEWESGGKKKRGETGTKNAQGGREDEATLALARRLRSRLLFSSRGFCIVDKPEGVHVQGGSREGGATLDVAASAAARRGWLGSGMEPSSSSPSFSGFSDSNSSSSSNSPSSTSLPLAARLVHRLDAPVSGAIAVAGDADTAARLARAFAAPSSSLLLSAAEEGEGGGDDGENGGDRRKKKKLSSFLSTSSPPSSTSPQQHQQRSEIRISKTYLAIVDCFPYGTLLSPPPSHSSFGGNGGESGEGETGREREGEGDPSETRNHLPFLRSGTLDGPLPLSPVAGGAALRAVAHARAAAGSAAEPPRPPRAVTRWRLLAANPQRGWALLSLSPLTGRRHQLRKHCAGGFGSPVAGDERYGATRSPRGRLVAEAVEAAAAEKGKERRRRRRRRRKEEEEGEEAESFSSSSPSFSPSCSSPNLMLYCSSLTIRAPEGGVTARARPPPHFEALARKLGWGRVVAARWRAAARAPATATGEWRSRGSKENDDDAASNPSSRLPRRAPRAGRRPDWAL